MFADESESDRCTSPLITAHSELRTVLFTALTVTFLFVREISRESLNGFAPIKFTRKTSLVLARTSLKVKVKGQGSRSPWTKMAFVDPYGGLRAVYAW